MNTDGGKGLRCAKLQLEALAGCGGAGGVAVHEAGFDDIAKDGWCQVVNTQKQRNLYEQEQLSTHGGRDQRSTTWLCQNWPILIGP